MKNMLYIAFIVTALAGMTDASAKAADAGAQAADASAKAATAKRGGVCFGYFRNGDSVLQCEHIGKVTIKQIYEKGFRVVHMLDNKNVVSTYLTLVIEEQ